MPSKKTTSSKPSLSIVVFSNFEGFCQNDESARQTVRGFESLSQRYPEVVWTHMFNPVHLCGELPKKLCGNIFHFYLLRLLKQQPQTEIGLHLHMFYDFVEKLGVKARRTPESDGYDGYITDYSPTERAKLLAGCLEVYQRAGLPRPLTFCAGYSATDPALQALLEKTGFTTSFAAQTVPPNIDGVSYPADWYKRLAWGENITPFTRPYRVAKNSILPPKKSAALLKRLVEIPLNTDTDIRPPHLHRQPISRKNILDYHYEYIRTTGRNSCVALGLHDVYLSENTKTNPVINEMISCLEYVRTISKRGDVR